MDTRWPLIAISVWLDDGVVAVGRLEMDIMLSAFSPIKLEGSNSVRQSFRSFRRRNVSMRPIQPRAGVKMVPQRRMFISGWLIRAMIVRHVKASAAVSLCVGDTQKIKPASTTTGVILSLVTANEVK